MKLYRIRPYLYQRGKFDKFSLAVKLEVLHKNRISTVVNLISAVDEDLAKSGICYIHIPIADSRNANFNFVENAVKKLIKKNRVSVKNAVLAHCNAGRNRSSLFSAIILMELEGLTGKQAITEIRRLRPNALANDAFCHYLIKRKNI